MSSRRTALKTASMVAVALAPSPVPGLSAQEVAEIDALPYGRDWTKVLINPYEIEGSAAVECGHVRVCVSRGMGGGLVAQLQEGDTNAHDNFGGWVAFSYDVNAEEARRRKEKPVHEEARRFYGRRAADLADGLAYFRVLAKDERKRQLALCSEMAKDVWDDENEDEEGNVPNPPRSRSKLCPPCAVENGGSWRLGNEPAPEAGRCALCGVLRLLYAPEEYDGIPADLVAKNRPHRLAWESEKEGFTHDGYPTGATFQPVRMAKWVMDTKPGEGWAKVVYTEWEGLPEGTVVDEERRQADDCHARLLICYRRNDGVFELSLNTRLNGNHNDFGLDSEHAFQADQHSEGDVPPLWNEGVFQTRDEKEVEAVMRTIEAHLDELRDDSRNGLWPEELSQKAEDSPGLRLAA